MRKTIFILLLLVSVSAGATEREEFQKAHDIHFKSYCEFGLLYTKVFQGKKVVNVYYVDDGKGGIQKCGSEK